MTPEEKQVLLKDLCARLPYDIKVNYESRVYYLNEINPACKDIDYITVLIQDEKRLLWAKSVQIDEIKPYFRTMLSMTEEETLEFVKTTIKTPDGYPMWMTESYDWLNAHHFDYRGLIPMRLALEAPEDMYNII